MKVCYRTPFKIACVSDCETWFNISGKYFQPTLQQVEHYKYYCHHTFYLELGNLGHSRGDHRRNYQCLRKSVLQRMRKKTLCPMYFCMKIMIIMYHSSFAEILYKDSFLFTIFSSSYLGRDLHQIRSGWNQSIEYI